MIKLFDLINIKYKYKYKFSKFSKFSNLVRVSQTTHTTHNTQNIVIDCIADCSVANSGNFTTRIFRQIPRNTSQEQSGIINTGHIACAVGLVFVWAKGEGVFHDTNIFRGTSVAEKRVNQIEVITITSGETIIAVQLQFDRANRGLGAGRTSAEVINQGRRFVRHRRIQILNFRLSLANEEI